MYFFLIYRRKTCLNCLYKKINLLRSTKKQKISCKNPPFMVYSYLRRRGETGRRAGLKILWTNHPCRFESDRRHQRKNNLAKTVRLFFHISAPSRLRVRARIYEKIKCIALARLLLSARRRYWIPPRCATPKVLLYRHGVLHQRYYYTATACHNKVLLYRSPIYTA